MPNCRCPGYARWADAPATPPCTQRKPCRVNAELDAGRAQDKASNAAVALKGLEQQLEGLRAEATELRDGGCTCDAEKREGGCSRGVGLRT